MYNCTSEADVSLTIDTSAVLAVLLNEPERSALLAATRRATLEAAGSLPWEIGNALVALARRRAASAKAIRQAWTAFSAVPIRYVALDVDAALQIAVEHGLYAYDAYVIEAARSSGSPLLSLDRRQVAAARNVGVEVLEVSR